MTITSVNNGHASVRCYPVDHEAAVRLLRASPLVESIRGIPRKLTGWSAKAPPVPLRIRLRAPPGVGMDRRDFEVAVKALEAIIPESR